MIAARTQNEATKATISNRKVRPMGYPFRLLPSRDINRKFTSVKLHPEADGARQDIEC